MQWFLTSEDETASKVVRDGTGKGNYSGTNGNLPIATGSNDNYKVNNIYDMAGNCLEWTLEANGTVFRVPRGGYFGYSAITYPASSRYSIGYLYDSNTYNSSRTTLIM